MSPLNPISSDATNYFKNLPDELAVQIFSNLEAEDLASCDLVCKQWHRIANDGSLNKAPESAFGPKEWKKYFGDVGKVPRPPQNITLKANEMMFLIPQTVNGKPLTRQLMGELVQKPKEGHATRYDYLTEDFSEEEQAINAPYWVVMTKDVLEGTRGLSYEGQEKIVKRYGEKYRMPKAIEAIVGIFTEHVKSGAFLFGLEPLTFTRVEERVKGYEKYHIVVGGFAPAGLGVSSTRYYADGHIGVAALRMF